MGGGDASNGHCKGRVWTYRQGLLMENLPGVDTLAHPHSINLFS